MHQSMFFIFYFYFLFFRVVTYTTNIEHIPQINAVRNSTLQKNIQVSGV
jgi:hypothetical protein